MDKVASFFLLFSNSDFFVIKDFVHVFRYLRDMTKKTKSWVYFTIKHIADSHQRLNQLVKLQSGN